MTLRSWSHLTAGRHGSGMNLELSAAVSSVLLPRMSVSHVSHVSHMASMARTSTNNGLCSNLQLACAVAIQSLVPAPEAAHSQDFVASLIS